MNTGLGFELHPAAAQDITQIWEYIAADNITAGNNLIAYEVPEPWSRS